MLSQYWLPILGYEKHSVIKRWGHGIRVAFIGIVLLSLSACSGRYLGTPSAANLPDLRLAARTKELSVSLNHVITQDGPGSWVKSARWDEYVLTVRSLSPQPLTIEKIEIVDQNGVYLNSDVDPQRLEKASEALLERYKTYGTATAISSVPAVLGVAAAGAASAVLVPVALVGAPVYLATKHITREKDRENIEREFARRQLGLSTLAGHTTVTGSRFFPAVPKPKALAVTYRVHQRISTLHIPLTRLAELHVSPVPERAKKAS